MKVAGDGPRADGHGRTEPLPPDSSVRTTTNEGTTPSPTGGLRLRYTAVPRILDGQPASCPRVPLDWMPVHLEDVRHESILGDGFWEPGRAEDCLGRRQCWSYMWRLERGRLWPGIAPGRDLWESPVAGWGAYAHDRKCCWSGLTPWRGRWILASAALVSPVPELGPVAGRLWFSQKPAAAFSPGFCLRPSPGVAEARDSEASGARTAGSERALRARLRKKGPAGELSQQPAVGAPAATQ